MEKTLILEDLERAFGKDSAQFKSFIRSIRDFPKGFEMPIRSLEDFEKMVRTLPCMGKPPWPEAENCPPYIGIRMPKPRSGCPHCRALEIVEKLKQGN